MTSNTKRFLPVSRLLSVCLVAVAGIVTLMPVHAFVSTWGGTAIGPLLIWKSWKEILLGLLFLLFILWLANKPARFKEFIGDHFVAVIGLYALLSLIDAAFHLSDNGLEATLAGLAMNLRYPLIAVLTYGVFRFSPVQYEPWKKAAGTFLITVGTVLAVIGILQVMVLPNDFLAQFGYDKDTTIAPYTLIDENPDAPRAFATLRGPNDFGAYLILPLVLVVMRVRQNKWLAVPGILMTIALVASSSRSAWIGALVAVLAYLVLTYGKTILKSKKVQLGIGAGFVAGLLLVYAAVSVPALRLAVFHSSPDDTHLTEGSTDAHWQATSSGISRAFASPAGCGPGCSGPASYYSDEPQIAENYYVQIAEEVGLGGVLLWLVMAGIAGHRLYRLREDWLARTLLASGIGISVIGVWLHVWSDDPLSLTWWALLGMVLGIAARTYSGNTTKKPVS